jgi:hypothetical protein
MPTVDGNRKFYEYGNSINYFSGAWNKPFNITIYSGRHGRNVRFRLFFLCFKYDNKQTILCSEF